MNLPTIDVWRMSASRPWLLEQTHEPLLKHLKYSGTLRFHLIESVLQKDLSTDCVNFARNNGYEVHVIDPAKGQGEAVGYALENAVHGEYSLKWEDDFMPVVDIPLDTCIALMQQHTGINQISFNKRKTMQYKWADKGNNNLFKWEKEQRYFNIAIDGALETVPLVIKEKWWFGSSIWRSSFVKPKFKAYVQDQIDKGNDNWQNNTHNFFNDQTLLPSAGYKEGDELGRGKVVPTPSQIEAAIGCYIFGKHRDPPMVEHIGRGFSIYSGEMLEKWEQEGRQV